MDFQDQFHNFHSQVGVYSERLNWITDNIDPGFESPGVNLLRSVLEDLDKLLESNSRIYGQIAVETHS